MPLRNLICTVEIFYSSKEETTVPDIFFGCNAVSSVLLILGNDVG